MHASRCRPLTRGCPDARGQLGEGEGLDEVVVGAGVEQVDLVVDLAECADDDDRELGVTDPDGLEHVGAPAVGQDQIEQDEVEVVGRCPARSPRRAVAARSTVCPSAVRPLTTNDAMLSSSSTTRMRTLGPPTWSCFPNRNRACSHPSSSLRQTRDRSSSSSSLSCTCGFTTSKSSSSSSVATRLPPSRRLGFRSASGCCSSSYPSRRRPMTPVGRAKRSWTVRRSCPATWRSFEVAGLPACAVGAAAATAASAGGCGDARSTVRHHHRDVGRLRRAGRCRPPRTRPSPRSGRR